ncbi:MAG: CDP-diacylglycerol--glycerol-3-phosphate 3-phosphatidyltransferase [Clostridiales bacterium]|nr:CDP-diacylglycerol--glycerol-3-phosphate 3-phosphatidyltransferase [Clostridiales bacterium]
MNLPNKLTMARILAVPVFIVLYLLGHNVIATIVFVLASLTDMLDGQIARKRGLVTNFGKIMDPLADKILVYSAFICLVQVGIVPGWMLVIILFREFIVSGLRTVAAADGTVIAAGKTGKLKTVLQMIAVPLLLLNNWPFSYIGIPGDQIFLWASLVMTIVSGVEYVYENRSVFLKGGI